MTQIVSIREELKSYSYCETAVIQLNVTECHRILWSKPGCISEFRPHCTHSFVLQLTLWVSFFIPPLSLQNILRTRLVHKDKSPLHSFLGTIAWFKIHLRGLKRRSHRVSKTILRWLSCCKTMCTCHIVETSMMKQKVSMLISFMFVASRAGRWESGLAHFPSRITHPYMG